MSVLKDSLIPYIPQGWQTDLFEPVVTQFLVWSAIVGALHLVMMDEDGFPGWLSLMHLTLATLMFIALAFATVIAHEALKE